MDMIILYILLVAYILAINFYAFILVKSLRDKEREEEARQASPRVEHAITPNSHASQVADSTAEPAPQMDNSTNSLNPANSSNFANSSNSAKTPQKTLGKLLITGALGGAIAVYVCMFVFKFKRTELLLMVVMPLLGVLNVYLWVLLFRSGFSFFLVR